VEKGQSRKSMFVALKNMEELRRLYDSDTPVLAYAFKRRTVEGWTPEHSHPRGQLIALTQGLIILEAGSERWMHPSQRCGRGRRRAKSGPQFFLSPRNHSGPLHS